MTTIQGVAATPTLRFTGDLTIYRVAELKQALVDAISGHAHPVVELSGVGEIDTAGVQLLLMARRHAHRTGGSAHLADPSPAVIQAARMLGLVEELGFDTESTQGESK